MLTLSDGRSELWQWDTGRTLSVPDDCSQVHFSNKVFGRSVDVDVVNGEASIPDILLQTDKELTAWAFVGTAENGYTKISKVFKVNKRNKPADYVFTPTDQTTLGEILDRIEDLENRPSGDVSEEDIQNAVNDYLEKNPVSIEEKDPTVPEWAKQPEKPTYTAEEVGAQPAGDYALRDEIPVIPEMPEIPSTLPNPHKLTITGAVNAEYDGSTPVEVKIPAGGGGGAERRLLKHLNITEEVKEIKIDTDENGQPFSVKELHYQLTGTAGHDADGNEYTSHQSYTVYPNSTNAGSIRVTVNNGLYKTGTTVASMGDFEITSAGRYRKMAACNNTTVVNSFGTYVSENTIKEINFYTSASFGVGCAIYVYGR